MKTFKVKLHQDWVWDKLYKIGDEVSLPIDVIENLKANNINFTFTEKIIGTISEDKIIRKDI